MTDLKQKLDVFPQAFCKNGSSLKETKQDGL